MQYHPHQIIASVYAGSVRPQLWMQGRDDEKNGSDLKRRGTIRVADRVAHVLPTCMRAHLLTHAPRIHSSVSLDMRARALSASCAAHSFILRRGDGRLVGIMKNARRGDGRYRMIHVWAVGRRVQSCAYVCVVRLMPYSASRQCIQSCTICVYVCAEMLVRVFSTTAYAPLCLERRVRVPSVPFLVKVLGFCPVQYLCAPRCLQLSNNLAGHRAPR